MVEVPLSKGYVAVVDDEDAGRVMAHKWTASVHHRDGRVYALRRERIGVNQYRCLLLHRVVMGLQPGRHPEVDHVNGDGLDNRRSNLRAATSSQNHANQRPQSRRTSSAFKGVSWSRDKSQWMAYIKCDRHRRFLGYFRDERDAAAAYDAAAQDTFGAFARVNGVRP